MRREEDFFVGYLPMPPALKQHTKLMVGFGGAVILAVALTLAVAQHGFDRSLFEFGEYRTFEGVILERPYPMLLVMRPGKAGDSQPFSTYLLVDRFKHGAEARVRGLDGKRVRLVGQLIYRAEGVMLELKAGSIQEQSAAGPPIDIEMKSLGPMSITGELVDAKCFLGVMNPGSGKVHRDCAARCTRGGVPLALVTTGNGKRQVYFIRGARGAEVPRKFAERTGEVVSAFGEVVEIGEKRFLVAN